MRNWLFGPQIDKTHPGGVLTLRSLRLDIDVVRDVYRAVEARFGAAELAIHADPGLGAGALMIQPRVVPIAELGDLSDSELLRLVVRLGIPDDWFSVDFRQWNQPAIMFNPQTGEQDAMEIAWFLNAEGRPRVRWAIVRHLPATAVALLIGLVGTTLIILQPFEHWPQNALGVSLLALAAFLSAEWVQRRHDARFAMAPRLFAGHRVVAITRDRIRTLRAQTHRDWKVGVPTAVLSAAAGTALGYLLAR